MSIIHVHTKPSPRKWYLVTSSIAPLGFYHTDISGQCMYGPFDTDGDALAAEVVYRLEENGVESE